MIQTIYCYYYTAHSTTWEPDTALYPFEDRPKTSWPPFARWNLFRGAPHHLRCVLPSRMPRAMPSVSRGAAGSRMTKGRPLPPMGVLSIPRSREVRLSTASGAISDDAPADEVPADDSQAPIDLVSETFESDGSASDSDHSSDVAEHVDQAFFLPRAP